MVGTTLETSTDPQKGNTLTKQYSNSTTYETNEQKRKRNRKHACKKRNGAITKRKVSGMFTKAGRRKGDQRGDIRNEKQQAARGEARAVKRRRSTLLRGTLAAVK